MGVPVASSSRALLHRRGCRRAHPVSSSFPKLSAVLSFTPLTLPSPANSLLWIPNCSLSTGYHETPYILNPKTQSPIIVPFPPNKLTWLSYLYKGISLFYNPHCFSLFSAHFRKPRSVTEANWGVLARWLGPSCPYSAQPYVSSPAVLYTLHIQVTQHIQVLILDTFSYAGFPQLLNSHSNKYEALVFNPRSSDLPKR